jgi:hypothetical protein
VISGLLRDQPAVRDNLPLVTTQNASSTGTDVDGYFSEGHGARTFARESTVHHCNSSYVRGTEFLMAATRSSAARPRAATKAISP